MNNETRTPGMSGKKSFLWNLVFLAVAALSVWAVTTQAKGFSPARFSEYLEHNNPWYLACALGMMLCYILFGALAILCLLKGFGYRHSLPDGLSYVAADLYFSAITPSATGGQPAEGYFMVKDGVPAVVSTVTLLTNLLLYTLSIVVIGAAGLIIRPGSFLQFGVFSRILIIAGMVIQLSLALLYGLLLWEKQLLRRICNGLLWLLGKLHLLRNLERKQERLSRIMDNYGKVTEMIKGKLGLLLKGLLLNVAHRACQILVTVFCFLAGGGPWRLVPDLFAMQSNVVLGAYCIPIPGSMGVTDYMMIDGFSSIMDEAQSANLELLSRAMSFYVCVLLCGLIALVKYVIIRFRREKT